MADQEMLKEVIELAIERGWPGYVLGPLIYTGYGVRNRNGEEWSVNELLFNKAVAKAFFGEEPQHHDYNTKGTITYENGEPRGILSSHLYKWAYHLQQCVISESPIKYYWEHKGQE